jgi:hypothetical protein
MTRYFFHYREGNTLIVDNVGMELASHDAALGEAERGALDILAEDILTLQPVSEETAVEVTTSDGAVIFTVTFGSIIEQAIASGRRV